LDLWTTSLARHRAPEGVAVPAVLAEVVIESGSAKDYDVLLGSGWLQ
jgi:hypothetical protein